MERTPFSPLREAFPDTGEDIYPMFFGVRSDRYNGPYVQVAYDFNVPDTYEIQVWRNENEAAEGLEHVDEIDCIDPRNAVDNIRLMLSINYD